MGTWVGLIIRWDLFTTSPGAASTITPASVIIAPPLMPVRLTWRAVSVTGGIYHSYLLPNGNLLLRTRPREGSSGGGGIMRSSGAIVELDWGSNAV